VILGKLPSAYNLVRAASFRMTTSPDAVAQRGFSAPPLSAHGRPHDYRREHLCHEPVDRAVVLRIYSGNK